MLFNSYLISNLKRTDLLYKEIHTLLEDHSEHYESDFNNIRVKENMNTDLIIILDKALSNRIIDISKSLNKKYSTTPILILTDTTNKNLEDALFKFNLVEFIAMEECNSEMLLRCIKFYALRKKTIAQMSETETLSTLQQFSAAVAHEFRQPLQVIAGYLQILEMRHGKSFELEKSMDMIFRIEELIKILNNINAIKSKDYTSQNKILDLIKSAETLK